MEKRITLDALIIFPNTMYPKVKAHYIISGRGVEAYTTARGDIRTRETYYMAVTDTRQVYEHYWNDALSNDDKVPAITHMLVRLSEQYGGVFSFIQPAKPDKHE
jgi:hypothetical protein